MQRLLLRRLSRRVVSSVLAFAMIFMVAAPALAGPLSSDREAAGIATASADGEGTVQPYSWSAANVRVAGADRLQTSIAVSEQGWDSSEYVIIATARGFADALVGGPLAYLYDAPLLPTEPDHLPQSVADEIDRLGATTAIVLGGTTAISRAVEGDLLDAGIETVERIGGTDRYDTAGLIAERFAAENGGAQGVILATGQSFPDALAVSGFAGFFGTPILLTATDYVPAGTLRAYGTIDPNSTLVIGGEMAVSAAVEAAVPNPVRIGGVDRYDTARLIAEFAFANGFSYQSVFVATGLNFPDALAVAPLAAKMQAPVVLTAPNALSTATNEFFNAHCSSIETVFVIGGTAAVSDDVLGEIDAATTTELSERVALITDEMASAVTSISPEGTMTFPADTPGIESIEESSVLVAGPSPAAPYGYLVRVTAVSSSTVPAAAGGTVSFETTMAALDEVILKGSIDITATPDPMFGAPADPTFGVDAATALDESTVQLSIAPREIPGTSTVDPALSLGGKANIPFEVGLATPDYKGVSGSVAVSGNVFAEGYFVFNISMGTVGYHWEQEWYFNWGWKTRWVQKPTYGIQTFETKVYFGVGFEMNLSGASLDYEFDVVEFLKDRGTDLSFNIANTLLWVGWVPVYLTMDAEPIITAGASFGGSLETGFKLGFGATVGVAYDYRYGWRNLSGISPLAEWNPWSPTVNASIGLSLGVQFDVKFYGLIGPFIGVQASLGLEALTNPAPGDSWWEAELAVEGVAGGEFEIFSHEWSIGASFELWSVTLAQAPAGPFGTPGVEWFPSALPDTGTDPDNCLPAFWDLSDEGDIALLDTPTIALAAAPAVVPPLVIDPITVDVDDFAIEGVEILAAEVLPSGTDILLTTTPMIRGEGYVVMSSSGEFFDMTNRPNMLSTAAFAGYYEPELAGAMVLDSENVQLFFDNGFGALDPASIQASDFAVPGVTVLDAVPGFNGSTVLLTTTAMTPGTLYTVGVTAGDVLSREGYACITASTDFNGYYEPSITSFMPVDSTTIEVVFDTAGSELDAATIDASDFVVPALAVTDAALQPDGATVLLTTDIQTPGTAYSVDVTATAVVSIEGYLSQPYSGSFIGYHEPVMTGMQVVDSTTLSLSFDDAGRGLDPASIAPTDFTIAGLTVMAAALQPDGSTVVLTTSPQAPFTAYTVDVAQGALLLSEGYPCAAATEPFVGYYEPAATTAQVLDGITVMVPFETFGGALDPASIAPSDFTIVGLTVLSATLMPDNATVQLVTSAHGPNMPYTIDVVAGALLTTEGYPSAVSSPGFVGYYQPSAVSLDALDSTTVQVVYDAHGSTLEPMSVVPASFSVPGLSVLGAALQPDGVTVLLTTSAQTPGVSYTWSTAMGAVVSVEGYPCTADMASFTGYYEPMPMMAQPLDALTVMVPFETYGGELDPATVDPADFIIPGLTISGAVLMPDNATVQLTVGIQAPGAAFVVDVIPGSILSIEGYPCAPAPQGFTGYYEPTIVSAATVDEVTSQVVFDAAGSALDPATVVPAAFSIPGLVVTGAALQPDGVTVVLTTDPQVPGTAYTASVAAGAVISVEGYPSTASSASFTGYWPVSFAYGYDVDATTVDVVFDSQFALDPATVAVGDFVVEEMLSSTPLAVSAAVIQPDGRTVRLTTDPTIPGVAYRVVITAGSISDGTWVSIDAMTTFTGTAAFATSPGNIGAADSISAMGSTDPMIAYATGMQGLTYRTQDGGATWVQVDTAQPGNVGNSYGIAFPVPGDSTVLSVIGFGGSISRSTDSADTFALVPADTINHNSGIAFAGATGRGYVVHGGGGMIETTDAGASWHRHPTQDTILGVSVAFADDFNGVVGGGTGDIWITQDSGASFTLMESGMTGAVLQLDYSPMNPEEVVAVSDAGEIAFSNDGGWTWAINSTGAGALTEVSYADGNVVFVGADSGAMWMSRDAGRTWTEIRAATGVSIGGMWVRDANSIWIGGLGGANFIVNGS